ncbi:Uncharacterised protein [Mycobacteroides abscessus subsp. abscessus]|nr:Uncharacterised protein [Mycobacteroides abscessus subsp. abscessus]
MGAPCWMTPRPPAAPEIEDAPTCEMMLPACTATITPNGIDTRMAGTTVTVRMNQDWITVSCHGWRSRTMSLMRNAKDCTTRST